VRGDANWELLVIVRAEESSEVQFVIKWFYSTFLAKSWQFVIKLNAYFWVRWQRVGYKSVYMLKLKHLQTLSLISYFYLWNCIYFPLNSAYIGIYHYTEFKTFFKLFF
jgi:hypothetical protein